MQAGFQAEFTTNLLPLREAGAVIYSLIETVKETGLNPFRYLTWILETAPKLDRTVEGWAVPLLPANASESCATA